MKKHTVRARAHHGAKSLDLTIPVSLCEEFKINDGDLFIVEVRQNNKDFELVYKRILSNNFIN